MVEKREIQPEDPDMTTDRPEPDWDALGRELAVRYREVLAELGD